MNGCESLRRPLALAFLPALLWASPVLAGNSDEIRIGAAMNHSLGRGLAANFGLQGRFTGGSDRIGAVRIGGGLDWKLGGITLGAGYDASISRPAGQPDRTTHRVYEQLGLPLGSLAGFHLDSRTRLEQRFGDHGSSQRLRQRLRLVAPLGDSGRLRAFVSGEALLLLRGDRDSSSGLEQMRGVAGLQLPLGNRLAFEASYMKRVVYAGRDRFDDVLDFSLTTNF